MNAEVTVREMMDREYVGVSESDDLTETVELLLREESEAAVVHRGSEHVGVVTERDILAVLVEGPDPEDATVSDVMSETVPTVEPEMSLESAADKLSTRSESRLLVTDGTKPLGFLTEQDVLATRTHNRSEIETGDSEAETVTASMHDTASPGETGDHFEEQGICEGCGTLTHDLLTLNGQALCADCREM